MPGILYTSASKSRQIVKKPCAGFDAQQYAPSQPSLSSNEKSSTTIKTSAMLTNLHKIRV